MAQIKVWDGTQWKKPKAIKQWDGTQWIERVGKVRIGEEWIDIISYYDPYVFLTYGSVDNNYLDKVDGSNGDVVWTVSIRLKETKGRRFYNKIINIVDGLIYVGHFNGPTSQTVDINDGNKKDLPNSWNKLINFNDNCLFAGDWDFYDYPTLVKRLLPSLTIKYEVILTYTEKAEIRALGIDDEDNPYLFHDSGTYDVVKALDSEGSTKWTASYFNRYSMRFIVFNPISQRIFVSTYIQDDWPNGPFRGIRVFTKSGTDYRMAFNATPTDVHIEENGTMYFLAGNQVIKTNSYGTVRLETYTLEGSGFKMAVARDGYVYITFNNNHYVIRKYKKDDFSLVWSKTYGEYSTRSMIANK